MKELLRHLFQTDPSGLQERTLLDCHVQGVHSVVLYDTPGARLRLFYATKNHGLYFHFPDFKDLPVGFHAHHCDVSLYVLNGILSNFTVSFELPATGPCFNFNRYKYTSSITNQKGSMEYVSKALTTIPKQQQLNSGMTVYMNAKTIHTVRVESNFCIWAVMEGAEDSNYDNFLLTTRTLDENSTKGLYNKPTMEQFNEMILEMLNLL